MIMVSRSNFEGQGIRWYQSILTYDFDLLISWLLLGHILGYISVTNGWNIAKF